MEIDSKLSPGGEDAVVSLANESSATILGQSSDVVCNETIAATRSEVQKESGDNSDVRTIGGDGQIQCQSDEMALSEGKQIILNRIFDPFNCWTDDPRFRLPN